MTLGCVSVDRCEMAIIVNNIVIWFILAVLITGTVITHLTVSSKTASKPAAKPASPTPGNSELLLRLEQLIQKTDHELKHLESQKQSDANLRKKPQTQQPKPKQEPAEEKHQQLAIVLPQPREAPVSANPMPLDVVDTSFFSIDLDSVHSDDVAWLKQLQGKLACLRIGSEGLYLYHVRKAAGTTVRDVLTELSHRWRVRLFETEGLSLDARFLNEKHLLSVTTMRDPINRILSLYWYEHVGWFDGILKQPEKCKSMRVWVDAWKDGSAWKTEFMMKNPSNLYVEIENYYVKMLTGWTGSTPITEADYNRAVEVVKQFDIVLLTEWMQSDTQLTAMNTMFPGRSQVAPGYKVKGDKKLKDKLKTALASDEVNHRVYSLFGSRPVNKVFPRPSSHPHSHSHSLLFRHQ